MSTLVAFLDLHFLCKLDSDNDKLIELNSMVSLFNREKNSLIYYCKKEYDLLDTAYTNNNTYVSFLDEIRLNLLAGRIDLITKRNLGEISYYDLNVEELKLDNLCFPEVADFLFKENRKKVIIGLNFKKSISILQQKYDKDIIDSLKLLNIPYLTSINSLEEWIKENREPRKFNPNPKHDEVKGYPSNKGSKVSKLECSKEKAQELLKNAMGDIRIGKFLFNYDTEVKKFIVFSDENTPNNQYHGYHVSEEELNKKYQKDYPEIIKELKIKNSLS